MGMLETGAQVKLKNILFLTDFSQPSEAALPFALSVATAYHSAICALHVITPVVHGAYSSASVYATPELVANATAAAEESAHEEMRRLDSQMAGLQHDSITVRDIAVWPAVERVLQEREFDLMVLGTHGRTGPLKLLMGSVAEEIFRRSPIPVLTIGPHVRGGTHGGGRFRRLLFATDFTPASLAALPWAISLAQENQARLTLLYVVIPPTRDSRATVQSAASLLGDLHELVPKEAEFWCRPEPLLDYGDPGECIVRTASQQSADLIVLGVRSTQQHIEVKTYTGQATAHEVVAHAECPVLTVRG
jgi:nucleotide-binding universal stress UspA family protein